MYFRPGTLLSGYVISELLLGPISEAETRVSLATILCLASLLTLDLVDVDSHSV